MFDELNKYKTNDHFFYSATDSLEEQCNAPAIGHGVCIVYELKHGRIDMVFTGGSGTSDNSKYKGIRDFILNGQEGAKTRNQTWAVKMLAQDIEALDVYWWVINDKNNKESAAEVEKVILKRYVEIYGNLPRWNKGRRKSG